MYMGITHYISLPVRMIRTYPRSLANRSQCRRWITFDHGRIQIHLTPREGKIFSFLQRVASVTSVHTNSVELRVAGGWVRDKLRGCETGDIDIAVRYATGSQFATRVKAFADAMSMKDSNELDECISGEYKELVGRIREKKLVPEIGCAEYIPETSSIGIISANPVMSRHLETATVRVDNFHLDFVQLRTETYATSADNRIPQKVWAGTPEQDAFRRDFTINALFYNLHTNLIEDLTGNGVRDLVSNVLRTPLNADVTLLEDPLRVLRAIRFACRFNFKLHSTLRDSIIEAEVKQNLMRKVSRERIGSEIWQILKCEGVYDGLRMIHKFGLDKPIFLDTFGPTLSKSKMEYGKAVDRVKAILAILNSAENQGWNWCLHAFRDVDRATMVIANLLWDPNRIELMLHTALRSKKALKTKVKVVLSLSLRLERKYLLWSLLQGSTRNEGEELKLWIEMAEIARQAGRSLWIAVAVTASYRSGDHDLVKNLIEAGLDSRVCDLTHAMNGRRLQRELGIEPGPMVGEAMRELMRLQLWNHRKELRNEVGIHDFGDHSASCAHYIKRLKGMGLCPKIEKSSR